MLPRTTSWAWTRGCRAYTTQASACTKYMKATHPDFVDAPTSTTVGGQLQRFGQTTLGTYIRPHVVFSHGKGLDLYAQVPSKPGAEKEYRRYLDFSAGIAVNSLGHADPDIARIAGEQAATLVHSSNLFYNEWSGEMADKLVAMTHEHGGVGLAPHAPPAASGEDLRVFVCNSGTEANEAALKFARKYAKSKDANRTVLVSFKNAFHGRTMGALSMTPNPKYQAPFMPLIGDVRVGTYNDTAQLHDLIREDVAGVIVEPVQGEGGVFPADVAWLQAVRRRCDEVGATLIYDEIQCGLFRTGTMWCHSAMPTDAHPDMVTMAKPLANGFPIGAVLMRPTIAQAIVAGDHGTTFGGGPLTCRIAHHVLGRLADPALVKNVHAMSEHLFTRLQRIQTLFPDLVAAEGSPRGRGLLVGLGLQEASNVGRVVALARERGVLLLSAGSDTVRFAPSLTVTKAQVDEAMDVLESVLLVLRETST
ncbi:acetylornithine aminotransferase [Malassezia pachydermatis]|uniref:acetylornithine transaminase n=1 Tax=Malassezia pachydermatis TaxID=77020 RepID=A0A0M8MVG3_9BASI|nr:acetylornithine aminotransferase [Malassezia pachydermatis]KOS14381.1 acetylornithine aminotransferase [Malassezia pachydermatis]